MAKIPEYTLRTTAPGTERQASAGVGATGNVGERIAAAGRQVMGLGEAIQAQKERSEIADVSAKLSKIQELSTNELNDVLQKATPEDLVAGTERGAPGSQSISQKFLSDFDQKLSSIEESLSTDAARDYFKRTSANLREHFGTSAVRGQAGLVGAKAVFDTRSQIQSGSSALMNDPSAFDLTLQNFNTYVDTMVAKNGLPSEKAMELRQAGVSNLAEGAARGWMNVNPEFAKKLISEGKWDNYISGDAKKRLLGEAEVHVNAQRVEQKRVERELEEAKKQRVNATQDKMLMQIYENKLSTKDIVNSPDLDFDSKREMLSVLNKHVTESLRTDPGVFNSLFQRVHLPDGDPNKITNPNDLNAFVGNGIDVTSLQKLRREMSGKNTPEGQLETSLKKGFMDIAKGKLTKSNPLTGLRDPSGDQQYQAFLAEFSDEYAKQRALGKTSAQLLSPTIAGKPNPEYLGNMIDAYVKTPEQIMKEMADEIRRQAGPVGAPVVGEIRDGYRYKGGNPAEQGSWEKAE